MKISNDRTHTTHVSSSKPKHHPPVKKELAEKIKKELKDVIRYEQNYHVSIRTASTYVLFFVGIHTHSTKLEPQAQVVMVENPELREKPLAITQKNIVVTCNYVARKFGIKKLMLIKDAMNLCDHLVRRREFENILIKHSNTNTEQVMVRGENLEKFRKASRKIFECVRERLEDVRIVSNVRDSMKSFLT